MNAQLETAKAATQAADAVEPRAKAAYFDPATNLVVIALKNGAFLSITPHLLQGLDNASTADLSDIWLDDGGRSIHWDRLDADFEIVGLVAGIFGTQRWMADLVSQGGASRSPVTPESPPATPASLGH
ncbi:hypothetical protein PROH_10925 [Prochlorothrix hollandica PCC 9006 = CALU 1027]|uniref:DUF2442 domain-containing protein n=1 Tax=Prochlorothrix hollandica PCC 9006 = CALU 1027 TaxID=317619 RepID=A0A0M2PVV3_PROHO|nr:hypothetical protein PROH_10925 [Prochlorothrix hollandica PCC 9006 = CALU 1027]